MAVGRGENAASQPEQAHLQPAGGLQAAASQFEQQVLSHGVTISRGILQMRAEDVFSHYLCLAWFLEKLIW